MKQPITFIFSGYLVIVGLFLMGIGGAFIPWIWHSPVALQLTAPGLAEFIKFLPELRTAQLHIDRLQLLYPLFFVLLIMPLTIENEHLQFPRKLRWSLRFSAIPLALASISPVWSPTVLTAPEFREQTILASLAITLMIIAPLFKKIPWSLQMIGLIVGGVTSVYLSWTAFMMVQEPIANVYQEPISLGIGWWVIFVGLISVVVGSIGVWLMHKKQSNFVST